MRLATHATPTDLHALLSEGDGPARAPRPGGVRIGQLLVEQGAMTAAQVRKLLAAQKRNGRPFGVLAEEMFGVSPRAVEGAWVRQYVLNGDTVDPAADGAVDPAVLPLLDRRQAWQFRLLPMGRTGGRGVGHLRVATSAGSLVRALNFAARQFDGPVDVHLAPSDKLAEALRRHYPVPEAMAAMAL